jgi:hypothetical protein
VPNSRDPITRLAQLEQILAQTSSGSALAQIADREPAQAHLNSVATDLIRSLVAELRQPSTAGTDAVDGVIMRLLLNEFGGAVGHLRAVARLAATHVDHAAGPLRDARRAVHRSEKSRTAASANWLHKKDVAR